MEPESSAVPTPHRHTHGAAREPRGHPRWTRRHPLTRCCPHRCQPSASARLPRRCQSGLACGHGHPPPGRYCHPPRSGRSHPPRRQLRLPVSTQNKLIAPKVEVPVVSVMLPLTPLEPESAVAIVIEPESSAVPTPLVKFTAPSTPGHPRWTRRHPLTRCCPHRCQPSASETRRRSQRWSCLHSRSQDHPPGNVAIPHAHRDITPPRHQSHRRT